MLNPALKYIIKLGKNDRKCWKHTTGGNGMIERKFEYFLSLVELGNITKAAQKNYISQPSMTQFMNRFEAQVGAKLFNREMSPITLTKAGGRTTRAKF